MAHLIILGTLLITSVPGTSPGSRPEPNSTASSLVSLRDAQGGYQKLLEKHVHNGRVDYRGIAAQSRSLLDRYLRYVASTNLPETRNERLGFLIDAYNALVIRSVIDHDRPRSVLDIQGFFDKDTHTVAGQTITLDTLEKKILNPFAQDPRTHFVLVCGAVGCPILESQPFFGTNVGARMEKATQRYLASPFGAKIGHGHIALSKIFEWYANDFGGPDSVLKFVKEHLPKSTIQSLGSRPKVVFLDYNWTLNQS